MTDDEQIRRGVQRLAAPQVPPAGAVAAIQTRVRRRRQVGVWTTVGASCAVALIIGAYALSFADSPVEPSEAAPAEANRATSADIPPLAYEAMQPGESNMGVFVSTNGRPGAPVVTSPEDEYSADVSPDGTQLTFMRLVDEVDSEVYVSSAEGGDVRRVTGGEGTAGGPQLSPDGQRIAYWRETGDGRPQIYIVDVRSGEEQQVTDDGVAHANPWWSTDGSVLYFSRNGAEFYELVALTLATGDERVVGEAYNADVGAESDGRLALTTASEEFRRAPLAIVDARSGEEVWRSAEEFAFMQDLAWVDGDIAVVHGMKPEAEVAIIDVPAEVEPAD